MSEDETAAIRANHVISAFGSTLTDTEILGPVVNEWGLPVVDPETQATSMEGVFCAGDLAGVAQTTVEATNDGKVAAGSIHKFLAAGNEEALAQPVPEFATPIDLVDLSVDIAGAWLWLDLRQEIIAAAYAVFSCFLCSLFLPSRSNTQESSSPTHLASRLLRPLALLRSSAVLTRTDGAST